MFFLNKIMDIMGKPPASSLRNPTLAMLFFDWSQLARLGMEICVKGRWSLSLLVFCTLVGFPKGSKTEAKKSRLANFYYWVSSFCRNCFILFPGEGGRNLGEFKGDHPLVFHFSVGPPTGVQLRHAVKNVGQGVSSEAQIAQWWTSSWASWVWGFHRKICLMTFNQCSFHLFFMHQWAAHVAMLKLEVLFMFVHLQVREP